MYALFSLIHYHKVSLKLIPDGIFCWKKRAKPDFMCYGYVGEGGVRAAYLLIFFVRVDTTRQLR